MRSAIEPQPFPTRLVSVLRQILGAPDYQAYLEHCRAAGHEPALSERQYVEQAAVAMEGMGMPRSWGKLLGWLLICDPPQQSSAELAAALDLSAGSVSSGTRMLENAGLVRRVAAPGRRGKVYEMTDDAFLRATRSNQFTRFRELMEDGLALIGDDTAPRAQRLRKTRDFYAFLEREIPALFDRFEAEYGEGGNG